MGTGSGWGALFASNTWTPPSTFIGRENLTDVPLELPASRHFYTCIVWLYLALPGDQHLKCVDFFLI
jgi:hypothetical protein